MTTPESLVNGKEAKSSHPKRVEQLFGAIALIAVAASAGAVSAYKFDRDNHSIPGITREQAVAIAQQATIAQLNAAKNAESYSTFLTEGIKTHKPFFMRVLNGSIKSVTPPGAHKGGPPQLLKDPILLSQANPNQEPDKDGKFLVGAWLGIQSTGIPKADIVITPIPYNKENMHFEANDSSEPVLNVGVYASHFDDKGIKGYSLIGYDPAGNESYQNADGSAFTPGRIEDAS